MGATRPEADGHNWFRSRRAGVMLAREEGRMLIGGVILLVIGVGLIVWHVMARRKAGELKVAKAARVANLLDLAAQMASEIGDGGLTEFVELTGKPQAEPLISPLGERPCLHYRMTVTHKYEEEHTTRDSEGRERRETRTGSEVMSSESDTRDFVLDDGSGQIAVRLAGADFDGLVESVDRFEPAMSSGGSLRMGRWSFSVGSLGRGRRTLGYQYQEHVLPFGVPLTVIGQASDAASALSLGRGGLRFIVSTRSRAEIIGSAEKVAKFTAAGSGVCVLAGLGLMIAHWVS